MVSLDVESLWRRESEAYQHPPEVSTWYAPTLVLHRGEDFLVSVQQANIYETPSRPRRNYHLVLYPDNGHHLPPGVERRAFRIGSIVFFFRHPNLRSRYFLGILEFIIELKAKTPITAHYPHQGLSQVRVL